MKLKEIREKTIDELSEIIIDCKKQLFDLRLQKSLNKLEDTSKIAKAKKLRPHLSCLPDLKKRGM